MARNLAIVIEQEEDGRWIAEIEALPGVMAYGTTPGEATTEVEALAQRLLADRLANGEPVSGVGAPIGDRIGGQPALSPGILVS